MAAGNLKASISAVSDDHFQLAPASVARVGIESKNILIAGVFKEVRRECLQVNTVADAAFE